MPNEAVCRRVYEVLRGHYFNGRDDLVDVTEGGEDDVHVVVVSRKLAGLSYDEKHDLVWDELMRHLTVEEWGRVSLTIARSPEEIKAAI